MARARIFPAILAAAWFGLTVGANAEQVAWRPPSNLQQVPVPPNDASRYTALDVRVSRYEKVDGRGLRRIIFTDAPRTGRLITTPISDLARQMAQGAGANTCLEHTVSDVREFVVDGRSAADVVLICRGIVGPGETIPNQVNVRRTVLIQGDARIYMLQADEYAPTGSAFDAMESASSWDDAVATLTWCSDICLPQ